MAKLTNAQLAADNAALRAQLDTQHIINRQLISDMATARALIAAAQPSPNLIHTGPQDSSTPDCMTNDWEPDYQPQGYTAQQRAEWKARQIAALPPKPAYVKPAYVMPAWQVERVAAMAASKAQAIASGKTTKVAA